MKHARRQDCFDEPTKTNSLSERSTRCNENIRGKRFKSSTTSTDRDRRTYNITKLKKFITRYQSNDSKHNRINYAHVQSVHCKYKTVAKTHLTKPYPLSPIFTRSCTKDMNNLTFEFYNCLKSFRLFSRNNLPEKQTPKVQGGPNVEMCRS